MATTRGPLLSYPIEAIPTRAWPNAFTPLTGALLRIPYDTAADLDAHLLLQRELVYDTTNNLVRYGNGTTIGGVPLARADHVHADYTGTADGVTTHLDAAGLTVTELATAVQSFLHEHGLTLLGDHQRVRFDVMMAPNPLLPELIEEVTFGQIELDGTQLLITMEHPYPNTNTTIVLGEPAEAAVTIAQMHDAATGSVTLTAGGTIYLTLTPEGLTVSDIKLSGLANAVGDTDALPKGQADDLYAPIGHTHELGGNADTLDGYHALDFALYDHNHGSAYASGNHTHPQSESHNSPDTDVAASSLHHTLGAGSNQAAAGNHTHVRIGSQATGQVTTFPSTPGEGEVEIYASNVLRMQFGGPDISLLNHRLQGLANATADADALPKGQADDLYAAADHTHDGADVTSAVANADEADTLDGYHALNFALAGHDHGSAYASGGHSHTNDQKRQMLMTIQDECEVVSGKLHFPNQLGFDLTLTKVTVIADTGPTGADLIFDIHKGGTTIFTNQAHRPTITDGNTSGSTTDIDVATLADGEDYTLDCDQIGSTVAGSDVTLTLVFTEAA